MVRVTDRARNDLKCVEGPLNRNQTKPNLDAGKLSYNGSRSEPKMYGGID